MNRGSTSIKKVLVIRNDKLGDFVLALPAIAQLKLNKPHLHVSVLVPEYTRSLAEAYAYIDDVVVDEASEGTWKHARRIRDKVTPHNFDACITLISKMAVALGIWLARIPFRLAPATKLAQIFYNYRLLQRRSRCLKPEYIYNFDLVEYFLKKTGMKDIRRPDPPYLHFPPREIEGLKSRFLTQHNIEANRRLIFVHPGQGGSAVNLTVEQYARLIKQLNEKSRDLHFVITAGPGEMDGAQSLIAKLDIGNFTLFESVGGLVNFAKHIAFADCFVSSSTGPLHLAGALNRKTAAFYPKRRSANPTRWQTPNQDDYRLAFCSPDNGEESDLSAIDMIDAAKEITGRLF
jgi:ADP-heptose:LPS heptosyltransferase